MVDFDISRENDTTDSASILVEAVNGRYVYCSEDSLGVCGDILRGGIGELGPQFIERFRRFSEKFGVSALFLYFSF